ncbi:MAG: hypothetical protein JWR50_2860 [Mucilaginibacter sp.]|nr:hypothetical protein [Mucilaginibacter sp.]
MMNNTHTIGEAKAWIKRKNGPDEVVRVVLNATNHDAVTCYDIYTAFAENPDYLGRILFDAQEYWIYDGELLTIAEQEQLAKFIINYVEPV